MNIILSDINWLAVAVGTIVYCAFCGIWHRQFAFGKKWEQAMGFDRPANWKETNIYYVVPLISCFVTTVVISIFTKPNKRKFILRRFDTWTLDWCRFCDCNCIYDSNNPDNEKAFGFWCNYRDSTGIRNNNSDINNLRNIKIDDKSRTANSTYPKVAGDVRIQTFVFQTNIGA